MDTLRALQAATDAVARVQQEAVRAHGNDLRSNVETMHSCLAQVASCIANLTKAVSTPVPSPGKLAPCANGSVGTASPATAAAVTSPSCVPLVIPPSTYADVEA